MRPTLILLFIASLFGCNQFLHAQASLATLGTPYTQDFSSLTGGTDGATYAWTNNTTLTGWYIDETAGAADDLPILEASYTTMSNTGSSYIFRNGGDQSLGSRAAGSTNTIYYGMRLVNNTGVALTSLYIAYYGEQWSIAENNSNINTINFDYQVGTTVTSLTAGTWTNVPGLGFTQLYNSTQSAGLGGTACGGTSAQCLALNGNLAANRTRITACITVNIPAGSEIMLRWADTDNAANDHHMQVDDIEVWPFDIACATILPVELINFGGQPVKNTVQLDWKTASENNNAGFDVQRSSDGERFETIGWVEGHGTSSQTIKYQWVDEHPVSGVNYYRLRQVDFNGDVSYSAPIAVDMHLDQLQVWSTENEILFQSDAQQVLITVVDMNGRLVVEQHDSGSGILSTQQWTEGIYIVRLVSGNAVLVRKIVVSHYGIN